MTMTEQKADLLTYNTKRENFDSVYERNKFYRGLFGYRQTVRRNGKTYEYEKDGLMDEIPNRRIDDSVFIIARKFREKVKGFFLDWEEKVSYHIFTVILDDKDTIKQIEADTHDTRR